VSFAVSDSSCFARGYIFSGNQAQLAARRQFCIEHFRESRRKLFFLLASGKIAKTQNGNRTADLGTRERTFGIRGGLGTPSGRLELVDCPSHHQNCEYRDEPTPGSAS